MSYIGEIGEFFFRRQNKFVGSVNTDAVNDQNKPIIINTRKQNAPIIRYIYDIRTPYPVSLGTKTGTLQN